ncbi:hypothetical protein ACH4SP_36330 [Streptomyces sp. NPDC021093]|uniref:hypothetical protein n=1 Tax=Streptomyces sp. NPDC021093 TaxID=3365112 RepID=UPI0037A9EBDE
MTAPVQETETPEARQARYVDGLYRDIKAGLNAKLVGTRDMRVVANPDGVPLLYMGAIDMISASRLASLLQRRQHIENGYWVTDTIRSADAKVMQQNGDMLSLIQDTGMYWDVLRTHCQLLWAQPDAAEEKRARTTLDRLRAALHAIGLNMPEAEIHADPLGRMKLDLGRVDVGAVECATQLLHRMLRGS